MPGGVDLDRVEAVPGQWRVVPVHLPESRMTPESPSRPSRPSSDVAADRQMLLDAAVRGADAVSSPGALHKFLDWAVEALEMKLPHYTWTGVYLRRGEELVLECFRGKPSPHTRIPLGQGICGAAVTEEQTIVVPDVNADSRYLACSIETRSEIVVPIRAHGSVVGEIDIDSDGLDAFGADDRDFLEALAASLGRAIERAGALPDDPQTLN